MAVDEMTGIVFYGRTCSRRKFQNMEELQTQNTTAKRLIFYKCRCAVARFLGLFTKETWLVLALVYRFCGNNKNEIGGRNEVV